MPAPPRPARDRAGPGLRPPGQVMRLDRMGAMFQTRLSFMRQLIRRMAREGWRFSRPRFALDDNGFGTAVYTVDTGQRRYSLIAFSHDLAPEQRTDRVIAEAWDATFNLFDGMPGDDDIERLRLQTPRQEQGRFSARELTLARANKSVRLFSHVSERLAAGRQPDPGLIAQVGYLMRTTAVYGSGKFGCADRRRIAHRPEMRTAFQAEMLCVYLIRLFTIDLVEHVARARGGASAVPLAHDLKRYLGIGNATGLGMAPFLISHPILLHNWAVARETALARVRGVERLNQAQADALRATLTAARRHVAEWQVEDGVQSARIAALRDDLDAMAARIAAPETLHAAGAVDALYRWGEATLSLEGQEMLVSILLEPFGDLVDDLGADLHADSDSLWSPAMPVGDFKALLSAHYGWALRIDFSAAEANRHFWYYSEEKLEPRFGARGLDPGAEHEMPLAVARDVCDLAVDLQGQAPDGTMAAFVRRFPRHRHTVKRVQTVARHPYGEIAGNVIAQGFRPIDMLRFKLAFFGASKFDPKSDLWTRITMYQGAPYPEDLAAADVDEWAFRTRPECAA